MIILISSQEFFKRAVFQTFRLLAHLNLHTYFQDILQYLISSGESLRQDVLSLWRDKLTHYAKIHSQEVTLQYNNRCIISIFFTPWIISYFVDLLLYKVQS